MIFIVTGTLGAGKSLLATERLIEYAAEGRKVAANFPLDLAPVCRNPRSSLSQAAPIILPSVPTVADLMLLGIGGPTEDKAGLFVWDECGASLNARQWNDKNRPELITWLLHARKRRWDVALLVQHERMLDKQVREALGEYVVRIRRLDRVKLPFLGIRLPRVHVGVVRYGLDSNGLVCDRWISRGASAMKCYDTKQIFADLEESGPYTSLPATYTKWTKGRGGFRSQVIAASHHLWMLLPLGMGYAVAARAVEVATLFLGS